MADLTVNLDVATTDSFAASNTTGSKTLTFHAGRTSETYTVATQADTTDEPDGSVAVTLEDGTDYTVASSADSASVEVNDDDATTVLLARTGSGGIAEAGGKEDVTITLGRALVAGESVTVPLAVSGATVTTHYTLALKNNGGTGVSLDTTTPHNTQNPAVKIEGAGAQTATLTLTAVANTDNDSRTVAIAYGTSARAPSSSGLSGGITTSGSASVPILDDDAMVSVAAASAAEGSAVAFTVTLPENAPSGGVTVGYSTSDGRGNNDDATHQVATSADYTAAAENATLSIAAGARSGTVSISTTQDSTYEDDHYFTLNLDSTSHFNLSAAADSAIGTITDAADAPSFAFSAASTDADEDDGTLTLTVEKTGTTLVAATVSYATTNDTATGGSDFTAIASTDLDFAAGDASKDITVSLTDDSADEPAEAFTVDLTAGTHAKLGSTNSHSISITDNDATTVTLEAPSTAIDENAGAKTITVTLGRALEGDETLDVPLTFSGTASFGDDYTLAAPNSTPTGVTYSNLASTDRSANPPTVSFSGVNGAAGSATVILTATADTTDEGATESVTVGLGTLNASSGENLDGGASGSGTATFNITDDDGTPTATLALTPTAIDESGDDNATTVTATLSGPSSEAVTLTVAAAAVSPAATSDFTLSGATLTIAAGATTSTGTVTVTAVDNDVDTANKTVTVSATATGGGVATPSAVTLTITDDDERGVTVTGDPLSMDEADNTGTADTREDQASYTLVLDSKPTDDVRIDLSAPAMVTLSPTSLTFTPSNWNNAQTVTATAVNDSIDNAGDVRTGNITHTVVAGASDYTGVAAASVAVTVNDDEGAPVVTLKLSSASVTENGGSSTVTATLSGASSQDITLAVAAAAVSPAVAGDFTLSSTTLTIAAGATTSTGTVTITAVDNNVDAANKTVTVSATATGGNDIPDPANATLTITDDDTRGISVSPVTLTLAEADNPSTQNISEHQKTYTVELDSQPTGTVTVNLASGDTTIATLSDNSLEFTASDWDAQTVTVTAVADAIDNVGDARTVRITHTVSATGTDYEDETAAPVDVTVTDDDGEPTLSIDSPTIAEGDSSTATLTFKVTLTPASGKPVSVAYADATTGTATSATDYAAITGGTLNFAVGDTEKTVTVTVNGDTTDEPNETVILRLSSPSNARLSGGSTTLDGTGTITDDDATAVLLARAGSGGIAEAGGKEDLTVTLGRTLVAGESVTVPLSITGATVATHYTLGLKGTGGTGVSLDTTTPHSAGSPAVRLSGAGAQTATLTLTAVANTDNASRTVSIGYGTGTRQPTSSGLSGGISTSGAASVPILDDDAMVSVAAASAAEGSAMVFTVTLPEVAPSGGVTVGYSTSDGRGNNDDDAHQVATSADYTAAAENATLSIAQGARSGTVSIPTTQDATYEGDHYFTLTLANASHFNLSTTAGAAIGTITDAADAPTFAFSAASTDADEDDGTLTLTVEKTGTTLVATTVSYATTNGTATGGSDFTAIASTDLDFAAGDASKDITVSLTDDSTDEPAEAFTVDLTAGAHARLGGTKSHSISITDNDATTVTLEAPSAAIDENAGAKTITVTLGRTLTGDETLDVPLTFSGTSVFGEDYTLAEPNSTPTGVSYSNLTSNDLAEDPPTIAFSGVNSAASSATVILTAKADTTDEGTSESVTVGIGTLDDDLDGGTTSSGTATFNIEDDDDAPGGITLTVDQSTIAEDAATATVTVTASVTGGTAYSSAKTVKVKVGASTDTAVEGTDYANVADYDLTINAMQMSAEWTFSLDPTDDDLDEDTERLSVTGTSSGITITPANITITDDDAAPTLSIDSPTVTESDSGETATLRFTVSLDAASGRQVTVGYAEQSGGTATSNTDYQALAAGTLTFNAGDRSKTIDITVTGDADDELNETVKLRLSSAVNAALSGGGNTLDGTGTITDDDATSVVLARTGSGGIAEAGGAEDVTITLARALVAGESVTVPLTVTGATETTHYTLGLKGNGGTGVSLDTTTPNSAQDPSVTLSGAGARTATLTLTAVANTDRTARTVAIAYGTSTRAPSSTGLAGGISATGSASVPILDDDAMVSVTAASVAEGGNMDFTVTLPDPAPTGGVTVGYSTSNGRGNASDATHQIATGADYTAATEGATINIAANASSGTIRIATTDDSTYEGDHYFTLTLTSTSHFNLSTTAGSAIGTITDAADTPSFVFSAASTSADEGDGTVALTVQKSGTTLVDATVSYQTADGTATGGSDFTTIASTDLVFKASESSKSFNVSLTNDSTDEPAEAFTVNLTAGADAKLGSPSTQTVNLTDNDATTVTLDAPSAAIDESGGTKTITVTLGRILTGDEALSVPLTFAGTAAFGADYTLAAPNTTPTGVTYSNLASTDLVANPPSVNFSGVNNAASSATLTLTARDDSTDEGETESVTVGLGTLNTSSGTNLGGGASGSGTASFNITDDDDAPDGITLTLDTASMAENDATKTVKVTATVAGGTAYATDTTISVKVGVDGDSAVEGTDYADVVDFDLTIDAMDMSAEKTFSLNPTDDTLDEDTETIQVTGTADGVTVTGASITLTDNDDPPTLSIDSPSITESDSGETATLRFTVSLDAASGKPVTVAYAEQSGGTAVSGTDYVALSAGTLTFAAGVTSKTIDVTVNGDATDEVNETLKVRLSSPTNAGFAGNAATIDGTGTITDDDDPPVLSINDPSVTEGAKDTTTTLQFTVTLSPASSKQVTVAYAEQSGGTATSGSDYAALTSGTLTFQPGDTSKTIDVTVNGDAVDEANETLTVRLSSPTNATLTGDVTTLDATGTINDDDGAPSGIALKVDTASVAENAGSTTIRITAEVTGGTAYPDAKTVQVHVGAGADSAVEGTDYTTVGRLDLTIAAGAMSQTYDFNLVPSDDDLDEDNETISVTGTATSVTVTGTAITLTDDDTRGVSVSPVTLTLAEADDGATPAEEHKGTYRVELDSEPTDDVSVNISVPAGAPFTLNATQLDFTPSNWSSAQTVTVTATDDALDNTGGNRSATISHSLSAADTDYEDESVASVAVTVNDDDAAPMNATLTVDVDSGTDGDQDSIGEGAGETAVDVTVSIDDAARFDTAQTVSITVGKNGDGAVEGTDYGNVARFDLTIEAGAASGSKSFNLTPTDDDLDEGDESLSVEGTLTGLTIAADSLTITDDDSAALILAPTSLTVIEGANSTFTVRLATQPSSEVTVSIGGFSSTDLTLDETSLTFTTSNWNQAQTVTVSAGHDADKTGDSATLTLSASGGGYASISASLPVTTSDDEAVVSVGAASAAEGSSVGFTVTLPEAAPAGGTVIDYSTTDGRGMSTDASYQIAVAGSDYTAAPNNASITVLQGQSSGTISIATTNDSSYEGDHHFTLTLDAAAGFDISPSAGSAVGTITDAADTPSYAFSVAATTLDEDEGTATLRVQRTGDTEVPATLSYASANGTATGGSDFTTLAGTNLAFTAAETNKTFTVSITDDSDDEPAEAFSVNLSAVSHAKLGSQASHTVNITDDDATTVTLAAPAGDIIEKSGGKTITVTLGRTLEGDEVLAVPLTFGGAATFGSDYTLAAPNTTPTGVSYENLASSDLTASPPTIKFTGVTSAARAATLTLTAVDDVIDENGSEPVTVGLGTLNASSGTNLGGGASGSGSASFNITDDDSAPGGISLSVDTDSDTSGSQTSLGENAGKTSVTVTAGVNGGTAYQEAKTIQVNVGADGSTATEGEDYATVGALTLTIPAGALTREMTFDLTPTDDDVDENDEVIRITGTSSGVTVSNASITLNDNDERGVSVSSNSLTIEEEDEGSEEHKATYTVGLDSQPTGNVRVTLNVPNGAPFMASPAQLDFTPSSWGAKTVTVTAVNDDISNTGGKRSATITHTLTAASTDYDGVTVDPVAVTVNDDDDAPMSATLSVDTDADSNGVADRSRRRRRREERAGDGHLQRQHSLRHRPDDCRDGRREYRQRHQGHGLQQQRRYRQHLHRRRENHRLQGLHPDAHRRQHCRSGRVHQPGRCAYGRHLQQRQHQPDRRRHRAHGRGAECGHDDPRRGCGRHQHHRHRDAPGQRPLRGGQDGAHHCGRGHGRGGVRHRLQGRSSLRPHHHRRAGERSEEFHARTDRRRDRRAEREFARHRRARGPHRRPGQHQHHRQRRRADRHRPVAEHHQRQRKRRRHFGHRHGGRAGRHHLRRGDPGQRDRRCGCGQRRRRRGLRAGG